MPKYHDHTQYYAIIKAFTSIEKKTRMLSLRRVPLTSQSSYCKKQRAWFRIYGEFVQKVNGAADYKRMLYLKKGSSYLDKIK